MAAGPGGFHAEGAFERADPPTLFGAYLDAVNKECARLTIEGWTGVLAGADVLAESHCARMVESVRID